MVGAADLVGGGAGHHCKSARPLARGGVATVFTRHKPADRLGAEVVGPTADLTSVPYVATPSITPSSGTVFRIPIMT